VTLIFEHDEIAGGAPDLARTLNHEAPSMKRISPRIHALLDYVAAGFLLIVPWLLPFPDETTARMSLAAGSILAVYSLMTDYDIAVLRFVPMPVHRALDLLLGVLLLFSPIHFATTGYAAAVFITVGLLLLALSFLTRGAFSHTGQDKPVVPGA
jgi:hypothetical protein